MRRIQMLMLRTMTVGWMSASLAMTVMATCSCLARMSQGIATARLLLSAVSSSRLRAYNELFWDAPMKNSHCSAGGFAGSQSARDSHHLLIRNFASIFIDLKAFFH